MANSFQKTLILGFEHGRIQAESVDVNRFVKLGEGKYKGSMVGSLLAESVLFFLGCF
jgi:hypothetical protein